jgi:hypothetical protein
MGPGLLQSPGDEMFMIGRSNITLQASTIIAPRDHVIQTTLDFDPRFPGHRGANTNPADVRRQSLFKMQNFLSNMKGQRADLLLWNRSWQD